MRYDLTRSNNLRWRCGERTGFIKTDGHLVRVLADEMWLSRHGEMQHYCVADFTAESAEEWLSNRPEFEIVPRDPETYKDWQVGDVVISRELHVASDVAARINGLVILSTGDVANATFTCGELFDKGFRLELTDYEKRLAGEASECPFKRGDRVLVRDGQTMLWNYGIFEGYQQEESYPYVLSGGDRYLYCQPYNEKTWKLLGTTDDYKEE